MLPRHVPPTGAPLPLAAWLRGAGSRADATAAFRRSLADYLGVRWTFAAASGRSALRLLLDTLKQQPHLQQRNEVVVPGYTCPSVVKVILDAGLMPRPVEMNALTLNMQPDALAAAVGRQTLAVLIVHPFGMPVDVTPAAQWARDAGALLIEDAAQSMGARQAGRPVGTHGDVGLYSLGPGKPLSVGGGGILATDDPELAEALAVARSALAPLDTVTDVWTWLRAALFSLAFQPTLWYWATRAGAQRVGEREESWGYTLRELGARQAAAGQALLANLDAVNRVRSAHAARLIELLGNDGAYEFPRPDGVDPQPIYLRLPLLMADPARAEALVGRAAAAGLGVGRMYARTIAEFFPHLNLPTLPGATRIATTLVTLPTNHHMRPADLMRLAHLVKHA